MAPRNSTESDITLRVLDIIPGTSVDGPGLRTSIYFAGCSHKCPGCHNPQSWDFSGGHEMTIPEIIQEIDRHGFNVTFSGGDPIYQLPALVTLSRKIKEKGYGIWCYTGFRYEELKSRPAAKELLAYIDVLVDGPFIESEKDLSLLFRGSANQRLIEIDKDLPDKIRLWQPSF